MVADTSGPTKVYGTIDVASEKASAAYWNAHGGIDGHPISITVLNDNGDETTAATVLAQYLTSHPKPDLLYPGTSGIDSGGLIPAAKRDHILAMGVDDGGAACETNAQTTCPTAYTPGPTTTSQQAPISAFFKAHGYKHVGILQEQDAFSESETVPLQAALKADGIKSTVASFSPTAVDVKPQVQELKAAGVDVIYAEALAAAAGYEASARSELGLTQSIPMVFDFGAAAEDLTKLIPAAQLKNAYEGIAKSSDPYVKMPGRDILVKYGGSSVTAQPMIVASFQWQDLLTIHNAAAQAKSINVDALNSALQNLSTTAQNDPLNMTAPGVAFTQNVHEDASPLGAHAYEVVPVGAIKNGMVYYKAQ
jgi:Periplasmic binding protein